MKDMNEKGKIDIEQIAQRMETPPVRDEVWARIETAMRNEPLQSPDAEIPKKIHWSVVPSGFVPRFAIVVFILLGFAAPLGFGGISRRE